MPDRAEFGWLPDKRSYRTSSLTIEPLATYDETVKQVSESGQIDTAGWFHPPCIVGPPNRAVQVFSLSTTHALEVEDETDGAHKLSSLMILAMGLLTGLRLVPKGWSHFYRVPTRIQQLNDIALVDESAVIRVLDLVFEFWHREPSELRQLLLAALHWHSFGRTYLHPFEVFNAQYAVLDTCWRIHELRVNAKASSHAGRVEVLAKAFDIPLPDWAVVAKKRSYLSEVRNRLVHEATWGGQPIGFAHPSTFPNIHRELYALNTRILLGVIGDRSRYITSRIDRNPKLLR